MDREKFGINLWSSLLKHDCQTNALGYLADNCQLVADARVGQLRSADTHCQSDAQ